MNPTDRVWGLMTQPGAISFFATLVEDCEGLETAEVLENYYNEQLYEVPQDVVPYWIELVAGEFLDEVRWPELADRLGALLEGAAK